jgi:hypothetical protein
MVKVITGNEFVGSGFLAVMRDSRPSVRLICYQVRDLFLAHVFEGEIFHLFFFPFKMSPFFLVERIGVVPSDFDPA